jgi:hypothetical protein
LLGTGTAKNSDGVKLVLWTQSSPLSGYASVFHVFYFIPISGQGRSIFNLAKKKSFRGQCLIHISTFIPSD